LVLPLVLPLVFALGVLAALFAVLFAALGFVADLGVLAVLAIIQESSRLPFLPPGLSGARPKQSQELKIAHQHPIFKQTGLRKAIEIANKITLNSILIKRYFDIPVRV
jgi:hypothetical protein